MRTDSTPRAHAPRFHVGVDGGGTGTRARLCDCEGRALGEGQAGPSGLGQGIAQAWRHVQEAVAGAFMQARLAQPGPSALALGLGLAGADVQAWREAFLAADPGYARCELSTDSVTQLLGAHAGGPGLVVAAGTGSVAAALDGQGRVHSCGGWGYVSGDEGSGAWLGLRAMRHAQQAADGRAQAGPLAAAVRTHAGPSAAAMLAWCAGAGQAAWAGLAPMVFEAADAGDPAAQRLLDRAAGELARLVAALDARCGQALALVVRGSVGERLASRLPASLQARRVAPRGDSCDGALRLLGPSLQAPVPMEAHDA